MLVSSIQILQRGYTNLRRAAEKPLFYPLALLLMGLAVYAYSLPFLGYYWDDWEVVFLLNARDPRLFSDYFAFDRPFAWPYQAMYALFGLHPAAWHVATLVYRWAGIVLLYYSLRFIWPKRVAYLRWLGALLLVYPGFLQQSISAAYNRHFAAFLIFSLSIYLMAKGVQNSAKAWLLLPLAWLTAFVQVFTIEYFVGLELIRPILLWLLLGSEGRTKGKPSFRRLVFLALPYMLLLVFYFWWRLVIFPTTIPKSNYAGDFKLLQDFDVSLLAGILAMLTRAVTDLIYSTLQVWLAAVTGPAAFTFQGKIAWFAFGTGIIISTLFALFTKDESEAKSNDRNTLRGLLLFGLLAFLVSALPIWLTSKQLAGGGRWDDRFSLAPMLGACLLTLGLIQFFVIPRRRTFLLVLLLTISITVQILTVNKYRLDWAVQNTYYWQLKWRVPDLMPQTAIISLEQPAGSIPGYDASFAMNVLFNGKVSDGSVPYWFFTNDRFLNFDLKPGTAIAYKDRNLRFRGNTSEAITIVHQGENRCLQVLDTVYKGQPFYEKNQEQLVDISNVSRILRESSGAPTDGQVFGSEPAHNWCYYFEKADLARQFQDWDTVLRLGAQADLAGHSPKFGPEYIPFIEANANRGNWQMALDLSLAAQGSIQEMEPVLCLTWDRLGSLPSADESFVGKARQVFGCPSL